MSEELVKSGSTALATSAGTGINTTSKFAQKKIRTLAINQPMSNGDDLKLGLLRITESGEQFDKVRVVLLNTPDEARKFYLDPKKREKDGLLCWSYDMTRPDPKAKDPQSLTCASCPKQSWDKWRTTRKPEDLPPCDSYYTAVLYDIDSEQPLRTYVRGKSKKPFEVAMERLFMTFDKMKKVANIDPSVYDIAFTISTEKDTGSKNFLLKFSDFHAIDGTQREALHDAHLKFGVRKSGTPDEEETIDKKNDEINDAIAGSAKVPEAPTGQEYTI